MRVRRVTALVVAVGATVAIVGTKLPWLTVGLRAHPGTRFPPRSAFLPGLQMPMPHLTQSGTAYTGYALAILVLSVACLLISGRVGIMPASPRVLAWAPIGVGLFAIWWSIDAALFFRHDFGAQYARELQVYGGGFDVQVATRSGVWICFAGGLVMLAGGVAMRVVMTRGARQERTTVTGDVGRTAAFAEPLPVTRPVVPSVTRSHEELAVARANWKSASRALQLGEVISLVALIAVGGSPLGVHLMRSLAPDGSSSERFLASALLVFGWLTLRLPFAYRAQVIRARASAPIDSVGRSWQRQWAIATLYFTATGAWLLTVFADSAGRVENVVTVVIAFGIITIFVRTTISSRGRRSRLVQASAPPDDVVQAATILANRAGLHSAPIVLVGRLSRTDTGGLAFGGTPARLAISPDVATSLPSEQAHAVIAHELSHCLHGDPSSRFVMAMGVCCAAICAAIGLSGIGAVRSAIGSSVPQGAELIPLMLATVVVVGYAGRALILMQSRQQERRSDVEAVQWCGTSDGLSSFVSEFVARHGVPERWTVLQLLLTATHPAAAERIGTLNNLQRHGPAPD